MYNFRLLSLKYLPMLHAKQYINQRYTLSIIFHFHYLAKSIHSFTHSAKMLSNALPIWSRVYILNDGFNDRFYDPGDLRVAEGLSWSGLINWDQETLLTQYPGLGITVSVPDFLIVNVESLICFFMALEMRYLWFDRLSSGINLSFCFIFVLIFRALRFTGSQFIRDCIGDTSFQV